MQTYRGFVVASLLSISLVSSTAYAETKTKLFQPLTAPTPIHAQSLKSERVDWYKDAVVYHLWIASFYDSDGNGVGDIKGITAKLDTLDQLGINTIWLSPFFESASSNRNLHGYDVINHYQVDPRLGTNDDIDELIREAHSRGIRLLFDFVPNHLSTRHPWFVESKDPNSIKRDWFVWRDERPEKNWIGFDQQSDWHELNGDFYYGIFWSGMPDVNHRNEEVRAELAKAARYWLDRGFDGMRMDAVRYLYENLEGPGVKADQEDQPLTLQWFKAWREEVIDPYAELGYPKFIVAENWTEETLSLANYLVHDNKPLFHATLNFALLPALTKLDVEAAYDVWQWQSTLPTNSTLGNFASNHDLAADRPGTIFADEPNKLRAQTAWLILSPGIPFIYYANEIGQPQGPQRGDTKHRQKIDWKSVESQQSDPASLWSWHQKLIQARVDYESLRRGSITTLKCNDENSDILLLLRESDQDTSITILSASVNSIPKTIFSLPSKLIGKELRSALSDEKLTIDENGNLTIDSLPPFSVGLYIVEAD